MVPEMCGLLKGSLSGEGGKGRLRFIVEGLRARARGLCPYQKGIPDGGRRSNDKEKGRSKPRPRRKEGSGTRELEVRGSGEESPSSCGRWSFLEKSCPEKHCLGLKVQQAAVREEPSSTHHPGAESERPGARPMRRGRRGLVNGQSEKGPSVGWVGGMRKGESLVRSTVNSQIFSSAPALAVKCCESVSPCISPRPEVTLGGAGPHGVISAFTGPMRHIGPVVLALPWARLCALDPDASSHAHASPSLGIPTPSRQTCRPSISLLMALLHAFAQALPMSTHHFFQTWLKACLLQVAFPQGPTLRSLLGGSVYPYMLFPFTYTVSRLHFLCMFILSPQRDDEIFKGRDYILHLFCLPHNT